LPRQHHDTPYRDAPPAHAAPARDSTSRPARRPPPTRGARSETDARKHASPSRPASSSKSPVPGKSPSKSPSAHKAPSARKTAAAEPARKSAPVAKAASSTKPAAAAPARRSSRRGRRTGGGGQVAHLTSQPTTRNAYVGTRAWLLEQHGAVCAYCGRRWTPGVMTLDHVTPRRGQTAYDRRDNLVLACPGCNAAKRDLAPLAFLLGDRTRAANLLAYGAHLSPMLLDLARSLVAPDAAPPTTSERLRYADLALDDLDGESPYRD